MPIKTRLLCCAALVATLGAPATAQTTAGVPQGAAPDATASADDAIVVTGIRASLQSSEAVKRDSKQIIDSVVAEDIGKLPDISVADTAARIAGVQVYRTGGEASSVLVRGLPFFETTYNGREIFTAETRVVALQDFPSQNVAALQVIKTSTADLVEPGLAGSVNVVSRMPFDFAGDQFSLSGQANYTRNAANVRPQGNFLVSHRWDSGLGEMGVLVNASYTELRYLDNELSNTDYINDPVANGQVVRLPDIERLYDRSGDRARPSANAAFQWKPTPNLEIYAEALWQGFRNRIDDRLVEADLYNALSYSNLTFRPGTNLVTGGTIVDGNQAFTFQGGTYNQTDTFQYATGFKWNNGRLHASADIARTTSTFLGSTESLDRRFIGTPTITFNNNRPEFSISGLNQDNPAGFLFQGLYEENQRSAGRGWQERGDVTYDVSDNGVLRSVQLGGRYTDRVADRNYGNRYAYELPLGINATALPVQSSVFDPGFAGTDTQGFRNWSAPLYGSIRNSAVALRQFVIANCPAIVATGDTHNGCLGYTTTPVNDPLQYNASEQTLAGYVQANYGFGDVVDGSVGVRVVRTREKVSGPQPAAVADFNNTNEFTDYLPNVSARFHFTPQLQGRLSFTQTRTLPNFSDLNPNVSLGAPPSQGKGTQDNPQTGGAGNPFLKPYRSDNYDASLEFYVTRSAFASVAYFHRHINGFIQTGTTIIPNDPIYGYVELTTPFNTGKGRIDGVEIQGQSFLDIASLPKWVRGFGVQGSVTFLNAKTQQPDFSSGTAGPLTYQRITDQLLGTSKFLYTIVGLYEQGPLSARITVNGRSSFLASQQGRGNDYYYEWGKPAPRVDGSLNYNIRDNATVFFDWTNMTGAPYKQYFSSARNGAPRADYIRYIRFDESVLSVGFRVHI